jgi:hypothetical protein
MQSHSFRFTSVVFPLVWASTALAQGGFEPPPDVKLTTRYSLDVAALWAEVPDNAAAFDKERRELEGAIDAARTPLDRAAARLALANWILAVPTAKPATKWLLNMAGDKDRKALASAAADAEKLIKEARLLYKKPPTTTTSAPTTRKFDEMAGLSPAERKLETVANQLTPFVGVMATAAGSPNMSKEKAERSVAARALAPLREVDNPELAASALMWQAFIWNLAGRDGRSTVSLPSATVPPEQPSYDFISRMIRLQILTDNDQFAAALAMAAKVRANCDEWFSKESPEKVRSRERLAALVQCSVGNQWMLALRRDGFPSNADRLEYQLIQLQDTVFKGLKSPIAIYTLERSIPILVQPHKAGGESSAKTEPPAATSSAPAVK